ncbi:hypothetical protein ESA94_06200 [Lacibacter luteus]|uniref:Nuclear transport factor 2 family protein n=1 Tax=Lacibacter luteus TaxID=2508719 RepID=A0A4Q1CN98_9BACT|nr:hypothetical protein [Lacibacter luteus]RXK62587.1 hypothetical protein ESA94_06200 [Lacibacter luteus]
MNKRIGTVLLILFLCQSISAQNITTVIKTEALKMARALAALDIETYLTYTYPTLVSDKASKEKIKQGIDSVEKYKKQYGIKVKSILVGNPSKVVTHKKIMQCTLPQTMTVEIMMGTVETETTLIGLSNDGKKWYFVDAMLYKQNESKAKLPELSPNLVIPPMKQPVMKPAESKN